MMEQPKTDRPKSPSRRAALRRLAGAAVAGYIVPEVLFLSAARAESSEPTSPSAPTSPSEPSAPAPSTPAPSAPAPSGSVSSASSAEEGARETCSAPRAQSSNAINISRSDLRRSQEAIAAGHAKPLDQIWGTFRSEYDGNIIGVEFLDRTSNARYRFRAISKTGRLETVTISAQTGSILRIVGC